VREPVFLQQFCWPSKGAKSCRWGVRDFGNSVLDFLWGRHAYPSKPSVACGESPPIDVDYLKLTQRSSFGNCVGLSITEYPGFRFELKSNRSREFEHPPGETVRRMNSLGLLQNFPFELYLKMSLVDTCK
jgi:hypothetical protein